MKKIFILCLIISSAAFAQKPVPAKQQTESILLTGGTAHIGNGKVIENSLVGFKGGKLTLVSEAANFDAVKKQYDKIIDVTGKQVYPGFIAMNTNLGLVEISAVRATLDYAEVGALNPNVRSVIAYDTDSKIIPTVRTNGVLLAQVTPRSGLISGSSSVVELDGWNWEDATFKTDEGIHLNWSRMFTTGGFMAATQGIKKNEEYEKFITNIKKFFADSRAYSEIKDQKEKNLKFEAMRGLFDGNRTLYIHADNVKEIMEAVNIAKDAGVKKIVLIGGNEAWRIPEFIKQNNIPVVVERPHSLPARAEDDVDMPYKLIPILFKQGILVSIDSDGEMSPASNRNIPFYAGTAAAYGLTKEQALMTITSNAAKILGIDDKVGTLETGKYATLFVSDGDALDMKTNNVTLAFIEGKNIDLRNEQKELYYRYMNKYGLKIK